MCDMSKIWSYDHNIPHLRICPHCVWIEGTYKQCQVYKGVKQHIPLLNTPEAEYNFSDNSGVSIFNSTNKYINSHLVVQGTKSQSKEQKHNRDYAAILAGVVYWVDFLHSLGINNLYMMLNSHFDPERKEKEHLHAFVSVYPNDVNDNQIFESKFTIYPSKGAKKPIASGPFPGDKNVYDITSEQAFDFIRKVDPTKYLSEISGYSIGPETSFYLFLYFNRIQTGPDTYEPALFGKLSIV
jgi:hypothetical protein